MAVSRDDHQAWLTRTQAHRYHRVQANEHEPNHRPATLEKQERKDRYGKFDPKNGFCDKCFMIRANNGKCTGGCDD